MNFDSRGRKLSEETRKVKQYALATISCHLENAENFDGDIFKSG